jgi:ubiquitin-conjugating enzyme E2 variant
VSAAERINDPVGPGLRARARRWLATDGYESSPLQKLVALGNLALAAALAAEIALEVAELPQPALGLAGALTAAALGVAFADLASGGIHFYLDNYATPQTPLFGRMAAEFQRHHDDMHDLLRQQLANVSHPTGRLTLFAFALLVALDPPFLSGAFALTSLLGLGFSQALHRWAHQPPAGVGAPPRAVRWLQARGLLLSHTAHVSRHHRAPFEQTYTIVTGQLNPLLDRSGFWRGLERVIHARLGREPASWRLDPGLRPK